MSSKPDIDISTQTLRMLIEACRQGREDEVRHALQAVIEGRPQGQSSMDERFVREFDGFQFTQANLDERLTYNGLELKRHPNGGGWVPVDQDEHDPHKAYVDEKVYVGARAMVLGHAKLHGGTFKDGTFYGGLYYGGTFYGGTYYMGTFYGGFFYAGIFRAGHFAGRPFKKSFDKKIYFGVFGKDDAVYAQVGKLYHSSEDAD